MSISTDPEFVAEAKRVVVTANHLTVDFSDGRTISVPTSWYPRLSHGTPKEWANVEVWDDGLYWEDLNESVSFRGLFLGRKSGESQKSFDRWLSYRARGQREPIPTISAKASGRVANRSRASYARKGKASQARLASKR